MTSRDEIINIIKARLDRLMAYEIDDKYGTIECVFCKSTDRDDVPCSCGNDPGWGCNDCNGTGFIDAVGHSAICDGVRLRELLKRNALDDLAAAVDFDDEDLPENQPSITNMGDLLGLL